MVVVAVSEAVVVVVLEGVEVLIVAVVVEVAAVVCTTLGHLEKSKLKRKEKCTYIIIFYSMLYCYIN